VRGSLHVEVEHPVVAPAALTGRAHGIDRRFTGPVWSVGLRLNMRSRMKWSKA
jgi:hypothetical protein